MVVTDPGGDVHACGSADELWQTVKDLLSNTDLPQMESGPAEGSAKRRVREDEDDEDEGYDDPDDLVAAFAGRAVQGLLGGLQRASFRGKKRRRKPAEPQEDSG